MQNNSSKKRKLHKIIIKHPSIPFRICPSIPLLIELDTVDDLIPDYEVKIRFEYIAEDSNTKESTVKEIFKEEMKKQEELDHLMTINHRRKSEISKGDEGSETEEIGRAHV